MTNLTELIELGRIFGFYIEKEFFGANNLLSSQSLQPHCGECEQRVPEDKVFVYKVDISIW